MLSIRLAAAKTLIVAACRVAVAPATRAIANHVNGYFQRFILASAAVISRACMVVRGRLAQVCQLAFYFAKVMGKKVEATPHVVHFVLNGLLNMGGHRNHGRMLATRLEGRRPRLLRLPG